MAEEIISQIKNAACNKEFEGTGHLYRISVRYRGRRWSHAVFHHNQKQQNDRELWNMIDSSFITTLPDTWAINRRRAVGHQQLGFEYQRVHLGGLTCDSEGLPNSEAHSNAVFLPKIVPDKEQYIGFFHCGAYQESLSGYGGIQHCLIPAPKMVLIDLDENGEYYTKLFAKEQSYKSMMKILGY